MLAIRKDTRKDPCWQSEKITDGHAKGKAKGAEAQKGKGTAAKGKANAANGAAMAMMVKDLDGNDLHR